MDPLVDLGVFTLDDSAVRTWLADPDPTEAPWHFPQDAPTWTPLCPGAEEQVTELIAAAQHHHHLAGPGELSLLFTPDADGDVFRYLIEFTLTGGTPCVWPPRPTRGKRSPPSRNRASRPP